MERILGDYKNQRNDLNNPFDPGIFRQYVINQYPLVVAASTGFLTFSCAGNICTAGSPQAIIPSGAQAVLIVTVQSNTMILSMIFT
jgi:hypothetical protein